MRKLSVPLFLLATGLLVLACQSPAAPVAEPTVNVQATLAQPAVATPTTAAAASASPEAEGPDPLSVDPDRPGFTLDGSATLGAADAPVIIIDFADFQ